jgi:hypothetical protein
MVKIKEIKGYDGYFIDTDGNVWTSKRGNNLTPKTELRLLTLSKKKTGYLYANIYWGKKTNQRSSLRVHRLVFEAFVGPITEGYVIDHINNIKSDNRLKNLQMLTVAENTQKYWNTPSAQLRKKN